MVPGLIDLQLDAKAPSMMLKYKSGWLWWREWALSKIGVPVIPAKPLHIALFISELAKRSSENNIGVSSTESAVYAIKWGHAMAGIEACPVSHPLVKFALEGAKKGLPDLFSLRSRCRLAPYRRLLRILPQALHFPIFSDHMSVYVPQHKNDQYGEGLARTNKVTCPVAVTEWLIKLFSTVFLCVPISSQNCQS